MDHHDHLIFNVDLGQTNAEKPILHVTAAPRCSSAKLERTTSFGSFRAEAKRIGGSLRGFSSQRDAYADFQDRELSVLDADHHQHGAAARLPQGMVSCRTSGSYEVHIDVEQIIANHHNASKLKTIVDGIKIADGEDIEHSRLATFPLNTQIVVVDKETSHKPAQKQQQQQKSRLAVLLTEQDFLSVYKRFFVFSLIINVVLFSLAVTGHLAYARNNAALFALANVLLLVLVRNEVFLRVVFWMTVLVFGHSWVPLRLKLWITHALQNLGGIHSGCGTASLIWSMYALVQLVQHRASVPKPTLGLLCVVFALLLISCLAACPLLRHVHHNVFENVHRLCGWTALGIIWCFIILSASYDPTQGNFNPTAKQLVCRLDIWFAAALTLLVFLPWVLIRKVPVRMRVSHEAVSLITFPDGLPVGVLGRIARNPLHEWHAFGIASDGFSENTMIVGAVGDFTKGLVSDPPTHLWTRQVRFAGVAYLANMYTRAVFVATGSGLGPFLSFLMQPSQVDIHLIWISKNIEKVYGKFIMKILKRYPQEKLIIHDTAILGRPNVQKLVVDKVKECQAEMVIVTSNPAGSKQVIDSCSAAGIPAFGPVWDS